MRNKIFAALVAGGLLVGAGLIASAVSSPATATAQEESGEDQDGDGQDGRGPYHRGLEFLGGVLAELVAEGTISQDDADAVITAVQEKAEQIKAERQALHEMIRDFLSDGVLTDDEASQLPEGHWLLSEVFDEAWADSELTIEEIREARPHPRRDAFRRGAHLGALLDGGGIDQGEYDGLSDNHPLKQIDVSEYLEDGVITIDELREIHRRNRADGNA